MKNHGRRGVPVLVLVCLLFASPAAADLKALNKCSATLNSAVRKLVSTKVKLFSRCAEVVSKCTEEGNDTEVDACIAAKATASGKACASDVLDPGDPETKLGKAIQKFKEKVDGKCQPSDQMGDPDNPAFAELVTASIGASQNSNLASGGLRGLQIECEDLGFTTALTTWGGATGLRDCLARLAGKAADEQVSRSNKRAFAALLRTGMAALADPVPIGNAVFEANAELRLTVGGFGLDVVGFSGVAVLTGGGIGPFGFTETAFIENMAFSPADIVSPSGDTVRTCIEQLDPARGAICCDSTCSSPLFGSKDYTLNQDHDSSGLNPSFAANEVGPADPDCNDSTGLPFLGTLFAGHFFQLSSPPCSEGPIGTACNAAAVGSLNKAAHFPRCLEGINARRPCTPTGSVDAITCVGACTGTGMCGASPCATSDDVACKTGTCTLTGWPCSIDQQCPIGTTCSVDTPCVGAEHCSSTADCSAGTCTANSLSCRNRTEILSGAFTSPPCNSAQVLTLGPNNFQNGDMAFVAKIQLSNHVAAGPGIIDTVTFPAGCANNSGDGKPDSYGCDGEACSTDDLNSETKLTVPMLLTTGTASSTLYDANSLPSSACPGAPGKLSSQNVGDTYSHCASNPSVGAKPPNGCANLSQNRGAGYELVATFPLIDQRVFGDGVISLRLTLQ